MSHDGFESWRGIVPLGTVRFWLLGWAVSEIVLLMIVVKMLGIGGAILLTLGTSVLGLVLLRRLGLGMAQRVRGAMMGAMPSGTLVDGTAAGLGALMLILPGFATDLFGLALVTPSVRRSILARLGTPEMSAETVGRRAPPPGVIDLTPDDWTVVDPRRPR